MAAMVDSPGLSAARELAAALAGMTVDAGGAALLDVWSSCRRRAGLPATGAAGPGDTHVAMAALAGVIRQLPPDQAAAALVTLAALAATPCAARDGR